MRQGAVVEEFTVKRKGRVPVRVVFRYPRMGDVRAAMRMVNEVRDEANFLGQRKHETVQSERKFIADQIKNMKNSRGVFLLVEAGGALAGDASISPSRFDASMHVGNFGIMLREEFTGLGVGTRLMRRMLRLARDTTGFSIVASAYFSKNTRSKRLHDKFGFKRYGVFPKESKLRGGGYDDHVYVYKIIKRLG